MSVSFRPNYRTILVKPKWYFYKPCQAGKDVYVKKPLAIPIKVGRAMIDAAHRHNCVVQVGTQVPGSGSKGQKHGLRPLWVRSRLYDQCSRSRAGLRSRQNGEHEDDHRRSQTSLALKAGVDPVLFEAMIGSSSEDIRLTGSFRQR